MRIVNCYKYMLSNLPFNWYSVPSIYKRNVTYKNKICYSKNYSFSQINIVYEKNILLIATVGKAFLSLMDKVKITDLGIILKGIISMHAKYKVSVSHGSKVIMTGK